MQFTRKHNKEEFCDNLTSMVPRLRRFALALTGSIQDSEDLVQNTLKRAINKRAQFRYNSTLEGWVFSILKSTWKNEIRSRVVRSGNGTLDACMLPDISPASDQEQFTSRMQLREALLCLPDHQKEVIALVDIEGMSYKEAAEILQIPIGTLMSRLARGRDTLLLGISSAAHHQSDALQVNMDAVAKQQNVNGTARVKDSVGVKGSENVH